MPSDDELREQLRKQADEIIEAIIASRRPAGQNSLQDLERLAIGAGQGFEEQVLEYLAQEESQAESEPVCEECGRGMRSRGKRTRQMVSEAGEIKLERRYYVCPQCGKRSFPPR
jgi:uncharacterized protein with PIN domain